MLDETKKLSRDEIRALLNDHGIMPTVQRVDIARLLLERGTHLSADDIYNLVNAEVGQGEGRRRASKATVYNTLGLFARHGIVREVIADPNKIFYDPNIEPHHHLYNISTGELTDIDANDLTVTGIPSLPEGAELEGVDVVVRMRQAAN
ncbi:MAG: Fur family transcriptional regulator [Gammaproteobacteria bacterium]|nr:MAG: Fur family transcriptional regulator [Gammaproteobacteria bacterium]